ncbi:uncharacterized protein LOC119554440 [Drosophila subpulchrella]|uniref:uncharacterized protein LOC119554440 n=1 Tax=Drosophila subpulchrella TaxID=1486046 RepID=UPI0018A1A014|nr:uncharacterized protein LOC119554440 [Drosophila subpulchrella]
MWKLLVWSVLIQLPFQIDLVEGERSVQFLTGNCSYNPKYFKNFSMTIVNNMMNMDMYLNRPVQRGFKAHIDILLRLANAKSFQSMFNQKTDVCATTSSVKNSLFKSWFKDMSKNGNFIYNCPVEVGHYYMHQWRMGSSMTHKFLIPGEYRAKVTFFYGKYRTKSFEETLRLTIDAILTN